MKDLTYAKQLIKECQDTQNPCLDLGRCGITDLNDLPELFECIHLKELILANAWFTFEGKNESRNTGSNNEISSIPKGISNLKNLKKLIICGEDSYKGKWNISDISSLSHLTGLQSLDLSYTQISDISSLSHLTGLQSLDLSYTQISDISSLSHLTGLQELRLSSNQISDISSLSHLTGLQDLRLGFNKISDISSLSHLTGLQDLRLGFNKISDISSLSHLTGLQNLDLSANQISDIRSLSHLTGLKYLYLYANQISDISSLSHLTGLKSLDLFSNQISDISSLSHLTGLQSLYLSDNQISDISSLSSLTGLQDLDLKNNHLKEIPPVIFNLNMDVNMGVYENDGLCLDGNPIEYPPIEILEDGKEAVIKYFEQEKKYGVEILYEGKILIVGEAGAGKTTLFRKLQHPEGKELPDTKSTLGVDIKEGLHLPHPEKSEVEMIANMWDFGGQEIQYNLHNCFITSGAFYILVADNRREDTQWDYWFHIIELLAGECTVLVVLNNRATVSSKSNFNKTKCTGWFPKITIKECEVDFAEKDRKWKSLQEEISGLFSQLPLVKRKIPKTWIELRNGLLEKRKDNFITLKDFYQLAPHVLTAEEKELALDYFTKIGIVTNFSEDKNLKDIIFLNPNWITRGLYAAIDTKNEKGRDGQFTEQWIYDFWKEHENKYTGDEQSYLLRLMSKDNFDICYPLDDGKTYVIPFLLPEEKPVNIHWDDRDNLGFRIQYPFMPKGILSRLTVHLYDIIDSDKETGKQLVWRDGVILNNEECRAKVLCDYDAQSGLKYIEIKIFGDALNEKKELLQKIRNKIQEIHKKWFRQINFTEYVTCNCEKCKWSKSPNLFLMTGEDGIEGFLKAGVPEIMCPKLKRLINIDDLIGPIYSTKEIEKMKRQGKDREQSQTYIENLNIIQGDKGRIKSNNTHPESGEPSNGKSKENFWRKTKIVLAVLTAGLVLVIMLFEFIFGVKNIPALLRSCSKETTVDTTTVDKKTKEKTPELFSDPEQGEIKNEKAETN